MTANASKCGLFLCPIEHDFTIEDTKQFITALEHIGLIAKPIDKQENSFYTGERYLDYIAYMGCAPTIQFEASETNSEFCHIRIHQHQTSQLIVSKMQARAPHCPGCDKPVKDWQDNLSDETIRCSACKTTSSIAAYHWRKMGGYARVFIEITDIYPKEAIPQQLLLDKLTGISKVDWQYFYSCG